MPHYSDVREDVSLRKFNTFHINVSARYFAEINRFEQLQELIASGMLTENQVLILGGGSNLLFTGNVKGIVAHIGNKGIDVIDRNEDSVLVKVEAGENWHDFVTFCVENGFGGLENLSLIPGNVGSCPIQNIGAYGVEVKDSFHSLEAVDLQTGELKTYNHEECRFAYRDSIFKNELKGKVVIWTVTFRLSLNPLVHIEYGAIKQELTASGIENPTIADVSKAVITIRRSKLPDPEVLGNAGSFFKNPTVDHVFAEKLKETFPNLVSYPQGENKVKLAAGWLIEQCGWKGFRDGYAGVHENQALVLVNYGNATGADLLTLAHKIQNSVYLRFGVTLKMEVNVI
jgi:UDP-N-acetylmuramate dehydrogenase